jgi:hypothetical protein
MTRRAWTLIAVVAILGVATAGAGGEAQGAPAVVSKQSFDGNLCKAVSASSLYQLKIPASCHWNKVVHVQSTPLGSVRTVSYVAHWGSGGAHSLSMGAVYVHGSTGAVAYARNYFRQEVLANGALFRSKPLASESGDTYSCHNPPISDCTKAEIMALVGHYGLTIALDYGPAKFITADDPQHQSVDDKADLKQEEAIKGDFIVVANEVIAALS